MLRCLCLVVFLRGSGPHAGLVGSGTLVPILFKKLKVDPAVASGPLITTINDLVAVVAYYGLAWWMLIQTLNLVG